jgi:hypothetical protein
MTVRAARHVAQTTQRVAATYPAEMRIAAVVTTAATYEASIHDTDPLLRTATR